MRSSTPSDVVVVPEGADVWICGYHDTRDEPADIKVGAGDSVRIENATVAPSRGDVLVLWSPDAPSSASAVLGPPVRVDEAERRIPLKTIAVLRDVRLDDGIVDGAGLPAWQPMRLDPDTTLIDIADATGIEFTTRSTNAAASDVAETLEPITIAPARYSRACEGGPWVAFANAYHYPAEDPESATMPPVDSYGDDATAYAWWDENRHLAGVGETPMDALEDLLAKNPPTFTYAWGRSDEALREYLDNHQ